jgi:hypothetical protein
MRTWKFTCRRDANRFQEMLTIQGIVSACFTRGMVIHVYEVENAKNDKGATQGINDALVARTGERFA